MGTCCPKHVGDGSKNTEWSHGKMVVPHMKLKYYINTDCFVLSCSGGSRGGGLGGQNPPLALEITTDSLARIARLIGYIWLIEYTNHLNTSQPPPSTNTLDPPLS